MNDFSRPEVILTHESDLDGLLSGLLLQRLAQRLFEVPTPLQAYHNHNWRQRALPELCAWVADFAFEPRLDRPSWLVVDHHPFERPPKCARLIHDATKSASLLCYELCLAQGLGSPELDRLVHLSNVADLFLMDDPDFDLATDYANLVKSYGFWNLHSLLGGEPERLLDHSLLEVMGVKRRVEDPLGFEWSRANLQPLSSEVAFVSTVVGNSNLIVHRLLREDRPPYPVLLTLFRKGNGMIIASLRSRDGEAQQIAELLKGGGHPNAAGATLPRSIQQIPDALEYLKQVLNPPAPSDPDGLDGLESALATTDKDR